MSYEIIYQREFLKISDGRIIPLVLSGSNNCWQPSYNGKWKRERNWFPIYMQSGEKPAITPDALMNKISKYVPSDYQQHFMRNGKWVDDNAFVRFFENGIKKAKTLEELHDELVCKEYLEGDLYFYDDKHNPHTVFKGIMTSTKELEDFLKDVDKHFAENNLNTPLYLYLGFSSGNELIKKKKPRKKHERLEEFYAITTQFGYVSKISRWGLHQTYSTTFAKQFKTEAKARKWMKDKDVERRFRKITFGIRYIA